VTKLSKQGALEWLRCKLRPLEPGEAGINRAWGLVSERLGDDTDPKRWRAWIERSVKRSRSGGKSNPMGYLLTVLADDPGDLSEPAPTPEKVTGQCEWSTSERLAARQSRDEAPKPHPPMAVAFRLRRDLGIPFDAVHREWVKQGEPWPEAFDTKGLERRLEAL